MGTYIFLFYSGDPQDIIMREKINYAFVTNRQQQELLGTLFEAVENIFLRSFGLDRQRNVMSIWVLKLMGIGAVLAYGLHKLKGIG